MEARAAGVPEVRGRPAEPARAVHRQLAVARGEVERPGVGGGAEQLLDTQQTFRDRLRRDAARDGRDPGAWVTYHEYADAMHEFAMFDWHEPERSEAMRDFGVWIKGLFGE